MPPVMEDEHSHPLDTMPREEQLNLVKKPSIDSLSSANTSIHSSRCSSMDHTRDTTSFTNVVTKSSSSPPPTPMDTSCNSRSKPSPLSPRSFRSSRSSRRTTAALKLHGLPKTPGVHSPKDGGRGGNLSPDTQSPPFSPRSFRSIFSGSNAQSPSARSEFSTTTTILSVPETGTASNSPFEAKHTPNTTAVTQQEKLQTVAPQVFDRNIKRSKNHADGVTPPTPSFFQNQHNNGAESTPQTRLEIRPEGKENIGPLSKLASKMKGILGSSGGTDARTKKSKSAENTKKTAPPHWTEL